MSNKLKEVHLQNTDKFNDRATFNSSELQIVANILLPIIRRYIDRR